MGPRPMTAPIRPKTPLLTPELEMKFDSAAPRPWTANTLDDANQMNNDESSNGMPSSSSFIQKEESQKHIRLSQLVQAPVEHMDTAKHVVEDATFVRRGTGRVARLAVRLQRMRDDGPGAGTGNGQCHCVGAFACSPRSSSIARVEICKQILV